MMLLIVLPWLNPPTEDRTGDITPPGNVIVHIVWDEGNIDVDLWVFGPKEFKPVGYSNKGGLIWNLLRDDLGSMDVTDLNYENSFSRGVIPGEYIINVHCFRCPVLPVNVKIEVSVKKDNNNQKSALKIIAKTKLQLRQSREEVTALRFKLNKEGDIVPGSINHVYRPLRAMSN